MCKRLCLSLMLAALAFLSAACDRKLPDNFSGATDKTDIGRPESTPVSENASVSDILPVSTAPTLPKTTAAAAPSPDSEPSQTTELNHLFHGEQAEVYQAVWDFLSDEYREKEFDEVAYLEETVGIHDARPAPVPPEA